MQMTVVYACVRILSEAIAGLVGDGGMRQFAQMIREHFLQLDYYSVTV